jgi:hypothetical protein
MGRGQKRNNAGEKLRAEMERPIDAFKGRATLR